MAREQSTGGDFSDVLLEKQIAAATFSDLLGLLCAVVNV